MTIEFSALNWFGVLAAFAACSVLGALWFTVIFKKQYLISLGKEHETQASAAPIFFVGPAICTIVVTITSALLMHALNIDSYAQAFTFALVVGFGYLFANTVNIGINPNIPRPIMYGMISGSYNFIGILISTMILFAMR